jgi:drug/metabolite transporter (DMT)-like permease
MKTRIAYMSVVLLWSTTPLAIKWSSEGVGFLFAVASRMSLGLAGACLVLLVLKQVLPLNKRALKTYFTSGVSIYLAMSGVYWAAQYIPSGWISVIFGLSPIITGVMAAIILKENALTPAKLAGMLSGLAGLIIIFCNSYYAGTKMLIGVLVVLACTVIHSLSSVLIKSYEAKLTGFASSAGGLLVAMPLFLLTCVLQGEAIPDEMTDKVFYAILYLGLIASTFGFALYYYILIRMDVEKVSLITLISPVCALVLGNLLNDEPIGVSIIIGASCISSGLLFYLFGQQILSKWLD